MLPVPSVLSTQIVPPCCSTTPRAMYSPRPIPANVVLLVLLAFGVAFFLAGAFTLWCMRQFNAAVRDSLQVAGAGARAAMAV